MNAFRRRIVGCTVCIAGAWPMRRAKPKNLVANPIFVRARLQSCRNRPKMSAASAAEGIVKAANRSVYLAGLSRNPAVGPIFVSSYSLNSTKNF
jgi:hypothetical protein